MQNRFTSATADNIQHKHSMITDMFTSLRNRVGTNTRDPLIPEKLTELKTAINKLLTYTIKLENTQVEMKIGLLLNNYFYNKAFTEKDAQRLDNAENELDALVAKAIDEVEEQHAKKMKVDYSEMLLNISKQLTSINDTAQALSRSFEKNNERATSSVANLISQKYEEIEEAFKHADNGLFYFDPDLTSRVSQLKAGMASLMELLNGFLKFTLKVSNVEILHPLNAALHLCIESNWSNETFKQLKNAFEDTKLEVERLVAEAKDASQSVYASGKKANSALHANQSDDKAKDENSNNFFSSPKRTRI